MDPLAKLALYLKLKTLKQIEKDFRLLFIDFININLFTVSLYFKLKTLKQIEKDFRLLFIDFININFFTVSHHLIFFSRNGPIATEVLVSTSTMDLSASIDH